MSSSKKSTYKYIKAGDLIGIKCFFCDTISFNQRDVENKTCPKCKVHHENKKI